MFPSQRQQELNPVLEKLNQIEGIQNIFQDDFDSGGINVFFDLVVDSKLGNRPMEFKVRLGEVKKQLRHTFKKLNVGFRVTDYPVMEYENVSIHDRCPGDPSRRKKGFDQTRFGIEVFV